jgi:NH3-dependent NAD+ synthetase
MSLSLQEYLGVNESILNKAPSADFYGKVKVMKKNLGYSYKKWIFIKKDD